MQIQALVVIKIDILKGCKMNIDLKNIYKNATKSGEGILKVIQGTSSFPTAHSSYPDGTFFS